MSRAQHGELREREGDQGGEMGMPGYEKPREVYPRQYITPVRGVAVTNYPRREAPGLKSAPLVINDDETVHYRTSPKNRVPTTESGYQIPGSHEYLEITGDDSDYEDVDEFDVPPVLPPRKVPMTSD